MLWKRSPKREVMRSTGILNWAIVVDGLTERIRR
jgi:hypothetical protein